VVYTDHKTNLKTLEHFLKFTSSPVHKLFNVERLKFNIRRPVDNLNSWTFGTCESHNQKISK